MAQNGIIRMLHVSDFHGANKTSTTPIKWWEDEINNLARKAAFDAVICSGDVGNNGTTDSLRKGFQYLAKLCSLSSNRRLNNIQLVITPGNQDVARPSPTVSENQRTRVRFGNFRQAMIDSRLLCVAPSLTPSGEPRYFATQNSMVAVVPICTTWVSGDLAPEYSKKIDESLIDETEETKAKVRNAIQTDMPFVRMSDINKLYQRRPKPRNALFKARVRIAVAHHPFWALPQVESTYRGFDIVANGMEVASQLERMGFQLILHGHKHYLGCSLLSGIRNRFSSKHVRLQELLSVSGGQMLDPDDNERFGFQTIEIIQKGLDLIEISIKEFARTNPHGIEICRAIVSPQSSKLDDEGQPSGHNARWMKICQSTNQGNNHYNCWQLRYDVVSKLGVPELVGAVDSKICAGNHVIVEGDRFLTIAFRSIFEFTTIGSRGVDPKFVVETANLAAGQAKAMIFVDVEGNGTWSRPDLIENAATLFRVYIERNHDFLKIGEKERKWKNRLPCLEKAVSKVLLWPPHCHQQILEFDLARILVWNREALYSPSALVLLNLHRVFQVPLFFVDYVDARSIQDVHDCHLVWKNTNIVPTTGMRLDPLLRKRIKSTKEVCQRDWIVIQQLLKKAKDPFKIIENKLSWLLG